MAKKTRKSLIKKPDSPRLATTKTEVARSDVVEALPLPAKQSANFDRANGDVSNLMFNAGIAAVFLDCQLRVQLFTFPAAQLLNLRPEDTGQPICRFTETLHDEFMEEDSRQVLSNHSMIEKDVWCIETRPTGNSEPAEEQPDSGFTKRCYLRRIVPYPYCSNEEAVQGVVITWLDITSRVDSEELRAILDATFDAVITINQQGIMVRINAATERLFGYSPRELIDQNVSILMTSPDRENHDGYIQRYLATKEAHIIGIGREVRCQRKDGSVFHGELSINEVDHLGLFTGMIRDISERRRLQNEILRAVSEEQRRIGQDLHDTAGQDLAGLAYLIESHLAFLEESTSAESPSDSSAAWMASELVTMRNTSDAIRGLQRKIRTVIRGLAPVDVSGDGLMAALTDLTAGIRELHHVRCDFHCPKPILLADNQLATHLYRIAQEAINNGLRHGGAGQISVSLKEINKCIILTIHDDGCGINFTQSTENGGFGLHIMSYRANLIGAKFSIQPGNGGGTTVCCRLPQIEGGAK